MVIMIVFHRYHASSSFPHPLPAPHPHPAAHQTTPRTGWVKRGVDKPESIADHMYRMGIMSLLVQTAPGSTSAEVTYNYTHCMKLALVHDIAESTLIHVYLCIKSLMHSTH